MKIAFNTGLSKETAQLYCVLLRTATQEKKPNNIKTKFCYHYIIFTFNKHFDKENFCVYEPVITKPHHWRSLCITFNIVNFLLFKKISTYLMK